MRVGLIQSSVQCALEYVLISLFRVDHILSLQQDLDARRVAQLEHMIQSGNLGDLRDKVRAQSFFSSFVALLPTTDLNKSEIIPMAHGRT
jgi:hypothetical protein